MIKWILTKIVGTKNQREVRRLRPIVEQIVSIEESWNGKGQEFLLEKTREWQGYLHRFLPMDLPPVRIVEAAPREELEEIAAKLNARFESLKEEFASLPTVEATPASIEEGKAAWNNITPQFDKLRERYLNQILPEAFAAVKHGARLLCGEERDICGQKQVWDMVHFDVQLLGGIALTAERKVCRLFGTDENDRQQVLAAYFCFCRQKGILFSGEMQLCQPEYPEPLGKDFLPWKWESGKVTPQLLQTIADQLRQCAPEQAADWCWLLGTRLVFTVLPLAKEALAALPQLERDAFFVQAEQFLRETATALGDQSRPLTKPDFAKLTEQYGKLLPVDSKEKLRRYARLYPTLACTKFPIRQKNGYVWLPEQPVRQSAKAASDGITLPEIRRELLLKQLQLPPEKIALEQVYPLCYEDMGFFSENGSHRKRGEDFLKEAPQLLQDYEAQHGKVLRERYSPEEWDWFRQAAD